MIYLRLFWEFFKTGLFAIGGGMATLPFLHDIGEATGWFTQAQLMNMLAVSESTPGPIGINMATYVGFTVAGVPGAVIATLGEDALHHRDPDYCRPAAELPGEPICGPGLLRTAACLYGPDRRGLRVRGT
jgi:hypothetical protein